MDLLTSWTGAHRIGAWRVRAHKLSTSNLSNKTTSFSRFKIKSRVGCLPRLAVTKHQKRLWCCAHRSLILPCIFPGRVNRIFGRGVHQQAASADLRTSAPVTKGGVRGVWCVWTNPLFCLPPILHPRWFHHKSKAKSSSLICQWRKVFAPVLKFNWTCHQGFPSQICTACKVWVEVTRSSSFI